MTEQKTGDSKKSKNIIREDVNNRPFSRLNFIIMVSSALLIVLGFLLMTGGGSSDPNVFSPDIFSSTRIVVGPLMAFLGFVGIAIGIIVKPKK
ncbi:MAG: DUF3098 domain-containing protein [Muribaculaceae bacterium]